jgi:LPS export ABC transporter protein LptC
MNDAMSMRPHASVRARLRAAIVGILACGALLVAGCERRGSMGPGARQVDLPDQEVTDFSISETDLGRVEWKLYAGYAATYSSRNVVLVRRVRVDFYDDKGQKSSELQAQEGEMNQMTRDMTARGHVVIQTTSGVRMTTESARFLNKSQRIVTEDFVRVERGDDVLTGYGFESDPGLEHFQFKREVKAEVHSRPGQLTGPGKGGH